MSAIEFKFVVTGPFGAGKTTLISQISNVPVVGTEVATTGSEADFKSTTTVGLEYGTFAVDAGDLDIRLLLYGTPGQQRFSFMWDVVSVGADGFLVLVDASRPDTWADAEGVLRAFLAKAPAPCLLGANRAVGHDDRLAAVQQYLGHPHGVPVVPCDVTDGGSARLVLCQLIDLVIDQPPVAEPIPALSRSTWNR